MSANAVRSQSTSLSMSSASSRTWKPPDMPRRRSCSLRHRSQLVRRYRFLITGRRNDLRRRSIPPPRTDRVVELPPPDLGPAQRVMQPLHVASFESESYRGLRILGRREEMT